MPEMPTPEAVLTRVKASDETSAPESEENTNDLFTEVIGQTARKHLEILQARADELGTGVKVAKGNEHTVKLGIIMALDSTPEASLSQLTEATETTEQLDRLYDRFLMEDVDTQRLLAFAEAQAFDIIAKQGLLDLVDDDSHLGRAVNKKAKELASKHRMKYDTLPPSKQGTLLGHAAEQVINEALNIGEEDPHERGVTTRIKKGPRAVARYITQRPDKNPLLKETIALANGLEGAFPTTILGGLETKDPAAMVREFYIRRGVIKETSTDTPSTLDEATPAEVLPNPTSLRNVSAILRETANASHLTNISITNEDPSIEDEIATRAVLEPLAAMCDELANRKATMQQFARVVELQDQKAEYGSDAVFDGILASQELTADVDTLDIANLRASLVPPTEMSIDPIKRLTREKLTGYYQERYLRREGRALTGEEGAMTTQEAAEKAANRALEGGEDPFEPEGLFINASPLVANVLVAGGLSDERAQDVLAELAAEFTEQLGEDEHPQPLAAARILTIAGQISRNYVRLIEDADREDAAAELRRRRLKSETTAQLKNLTGDLERAVTLLNQQSETA